MARPNWHRDWEEKVFGILDRNFVGYEKTAFSISSNMKRYRDHDWDKILRSGQVVNIEFSSNRKTHLNVVAYSEDDLPVIVGKIDFFDDSIEWKTAIVGQLLLKDLVYQSGDSKNCLEFDQPIILMDALYPPEGLINDPVLRVAKKGKSSSGCLGCGSIILILAFAASALSFVLASL